MACVMHVPKTVGGNEGRKGDYGNGGELHDETVKSERRKVVEDGEGGGRRRGGRTLDGRELSSRWLRRGTERKSKEGDG